MRKTSKNYFWEISNSPYSSNFLSESVDFGSINPCFLLDQYSGRRPTLINEDFIQNGEIKFKLYPSALLDSNLASQVYAAANNGTVNDGFRDFLIFLTKNKWDFSLYFYYIEHFCKATSNEIFEENATARTFALLRLLSMDNVLFLENGTIAPNPSAVAHYLQNENSNDLEEVAHKRVRRFMDSHSKRDTLERLAAIETAIMKMFLIRKIEHPNATPEKQFEEFLSFLVRDLDAILAREAHLALHYFYDQAGRLLGIQSNTPYERALSTIRSTAWDMYLLRFPERFFSGSPDELCLSYIATQEKSLAALAKLFSVERISGTDSGHLLPEIGFKMDNLPPNAPQPQLTRPALADTRKTVPVGLRDALIAEIKRVLPK